MKGELKTIRFALEARLGIKLTAAMDIWAWLPRYAAYIRMRFQVRASGRTAYTELTNTDFREELGEFGECLMFQDAASNTGEMRERSAG